MILIFRNHGSHGTLKRIKDCPAGTEAQARRPFFTLASCLSRRCSGDIMASYDLDYKVTARRLSPAWIIALAGFGLGWLAPAAMAKEPSLTAIELYDGPSGAAYVQLTDVLINAKAEMKDCTPYQQATVDHSTYNKMEQVHLAPGGILERGTDGVLRYTVSGAQAVCVVPLNAKFEHGASYSLSDLADQAHLTGAAFGPSGGGAQVINKGVTLVLVSGTNIELAEFLRAQRANTIDGWQNYLATNPASHPAHNLTRAKAALATLFVNEGEVSLQAYEKTQNLDSPSYSDLKAAKTRADQARGQSPDLAEYKKLDEEVGKDLTSITDKGSSELDAYRTALKTNTVGYLHLLNAKKYSDILSGIDSFFQPAQALLEGVTKDINDFEGALRSAQTNLDGKQYDQAFQFVAPYRAFADEEPRVAFVIDTAYTYHMTQGNNFGRSDNWQSAINEFEKAGSEKDTPAARDALKNANVQLGVTQDKAAAAKALVASKEYQDQKKTVDAYEVLAALATPSRLALVADEMTALQPAYILAAAAEAKSLHQTHTPIRGVPDKRAIERAFEDYDHAYALSENDGYKEKRDLEGDALSAYLLDQAKTYLAKPGGSGTEMGFACLEEARQYKSNLEAIRDSEEDTIQAQAHQYRSKLWISVRFQDQTSERDNANFYTQLENAILTKLETSAIQVTAMHSADVANMKGDLKPDFELIGDVMTHHLTSIPVDESQESEYSAGTENQENEDWKKADRALIKAKNELTTAQSALQGGEARGNKKEIEQLQDTVTTTSKAVEDAQSAEDNIHQFKAVDVIRKYSYTKKTITTKCEIRLQVRIVDALTGRGNEITLDPIEKSDTQKDILNEDVELHDTKGVKKSDIAKDPQEFRIQTENAARDQLTDEVSKKVELLPERFYAIAAAREKEDDPIPAAEFYLRYLEVAKDEKTTERDNARRFLQQQFDLRPKMTITP